MSLLSDFELIKKFHLQPSDKIIDIGGSAKQHDKILIDTLVDIVHPEKVPYSPSKLKAKKFIQVDIACEKLPFDNKKFDFCFCTHTLEDLYDPFLAISEISRIAKRGYISTPSRGKDMEFSHFDITDWLTGPRRIPGHAHHHWFFEKKDNAMFIVPKNYPLLYTKEFQIVKWRGVEEFQFYWSESIRYKVFKSTDFHDLIQNYREFIKKNERHIKKGMALIFTDNPFYILRETVRFLLKRGEGFRHNS